MTANLKPFTGKGHKNSPCSPAVIAFVDALDPWLCVLFFRKVCPLEVYLIYY